MQKNRNRWTSTQKAEIVRYAKENGITNASRYFDVSTVSIRNWMYPDQYKEKKRKNLSNEALRQKNRERAKKNYDKDPDGHKSRSKKSRAKRRFKRLVEMSNRFFTKDEWLTALDIWRIAKKQKLICALTGDKLTNDTISIDHIIPKSQGGSNKPENIRLVDKDVNLARRALTDQQFIELCKKVVSHLDPRP